MDDHHQTDSARWIGDLVTPQADPSLFARTRNLLARGGDAAIGRFRAATGSTPEPAVTTGSLADDIAACIDPSVAEMAGRRRAAAIAEWYERADAAERRQFFELLARFFGVDRAQLDRAIADRQSVVDRSPDELAPDDLAAMIDAERALRAALRSPREVLFRRFNTLEHGVKFVVDLRADVRALRGERPEYRAMDAELRDLLGAWFDVGNLDLRQITWDTPAALLEKLIRYESVHAIKSWSDLKNRLSQDRRCYAFFHPGMSDEPLIFVEVALVRGLADDLGELLDVSAPVLDPSTCDTAIFYSISNCQPGLAGVNLGDLLIKQVVGALLDELPHLTTFSTLSPIPGFRSWLEERLTEPGSGYLSTSERSRISEHLGLTGTGAEAATGLLNALADPAWLNDPAADTALRAPLLRLAVSYLTEAKRRDRALDRVANFHLSNGARIEQINWRANVSEMGLSRSLGIMVNYRYVPKHIADNHERYAATGDISVAPAVTDLMAEADTT